MSLQPETFKQLQPVLTISFWYLLVCKVQPPGRIIIQWQTWQIKLRAKECSNSPTHLLLSIAITCMPEWFSCNVLVEWPNRLTLSCQILMRSQWLEWARFATRVTAIIESLYNVYIQCVTPTHHAQTKKSVRNNKKIKSQSSYWELWKETLHAIAFSNSPNSIIGRSVVEISLFVTSSIIVFHSVK